MRGRRRPLPHHPYLNSSRLFSNLTLQTPAQGPRSGPFLTPAERPAMSYFSSFFTLPSLPTLPTSYLPSFPSLPQNLQRRFLSYVLKKSFGHLVKDGALDPERIEAQVVTGHVEVKGVELDESVSPRPNGCSFPLAFNSLTCPSLGLVTGHQRPYTSLCATPTRIRFARDSHGGSRQRPSLSRADDLVLPTLVELLAQPRPYPSPSQPRLRSYSTLELDRWISACRGRTDG